MTDILTSYPLYTVVLLLLDVQRLIKAVYVESSIILRELWVFEHPAGHSKGESMEIILNMSKAIIVPKTLRREIR